MLIGWGGNNGSTLTASLLAHKHNISWNSKKGIEYPDYLGSLLMSSTLNIGSQNGKPIYIPFSSAIPMIDPKNIEISGWDINNMNLADCLDRSQIFEYDLKQKLKPYMSDLVPLKSIYDPSYIAMNQKDRANNCFLMELTHKEKIDLIRQDIRNFKEKNNLDKIILVWTANTEKNSEILLNLNDTSKSLLENLSSNKSQIAPSTLFAIASIFENCPFINGSPQNSFVPGLIELAVEKRVPIAGDDFKSGQTKMKSVLVDFLIGAGIKPLSIVSYNHLGNNDGLNLSAPEQFRSKEISKSTVCDDMLTSNNILFPKKSDYPDHLVVIKYVPNVGDSKRAMDEYESKIFMGGRNTISIHNVCEDSLLAAPIILDLVLFMELITRVEIKKLDKNGSTDFEKLHPVSSLLSYFLKAPRVPNNTLVVNALSKQRMAIENFFRSLLGLPPNSELDFENKLLLNNINL